MNACNEIHSSKKALLQCSRLFEPAELIQQDHLRRERAQRHLHRIFFGNTGQNIHGGRRAAKFRREQLAPLVNDCCAAARPPKLLCRLTKQRSLAASRLSGEKQPCKMLFQKPT